jgi:Acetoacetate decarboxylase (ADC)
VSQPTYIERSGEQVYAQPFAATGVEFFGFAVPADLDSLQRNVCDRYLNAALGGGASRFRAAVRHVLFVFNTIAALRAEPAPDRDRGWFPEQEAAVWTIVADREREKLFWFHPYMIVDNSYAMAMGREIYGFPKTIGWFEIPHGPDPPSRLRVDTLVVREFSPDCEGGRARLFEVRQEGPEKVHHRGLTFSGLEELCVEIVRLLGVERGFFRELALGEHVFDDLVHGRLPMVFLKQFRDGVDPTRACFQSIQEVDSRLTKFHDARILHDGYRIEIDDVASHPVRRDLGLPAGSLESELSFWASFDFAIGSCTEVWRAPA